MDPIGRPVPKNAIEVSGRFGFESGNAVRLNRIAMNDGMIGFALDPDKQGFLGEQESRLVLIEYEAPARAPDSTMRHFYRNLGERPVRHDFEKMAYAADDFDLALGAPGLHTIRRKVDWIERQSVPPPELFRRFDNDMLWRPPDVSIRGGPIIPIDG